MPLLRRASSFDFNDEFLEDDYDATAPPASQPAVATAPAPLAPAPLVEDLEDSEALPVASDAAAAESTAVARPEPPTASRTQRRRVALPILAVLLALLAGALGTGVLPHHGGHSSLPVAATAKPAPVAPAARKHPAFHRVVRRHRPRPRPHRRPVWVVSAPVAPAPPPVAPVAVPAAPAVSAGGEFVIGG